LAARTTRRTTMKTVRQLRDSATLERTRADALRKEAQQHRDKANNYLPDDTARSIQETDTAQKLEQKAGEHDQTALGFEQQAADLESKALDVERRQQELQASSQQQLAQLDQEKKALRGEG